jgi:hypothetical protein
MEQKSIAGRNFRRVSTADLTADFTVKSLNSNKKAA